jgi:hypothetical protein
LIVLGALQIQITGIAMRKLGWILGAVMFIHGCASPPPGENTVATDAPKPPAKTSPKVTKAEKDTKPESVPDHLVFSDNSKFDSQLSDYLGDDPAKFTIDPVTDMSPNDLPPRLEKWLSVVKKSGGKVKLQKAPPVTAADGPTSRTFIITELIDLAVTAYEYISEMRLYSSAKAYDATVVYDGTNIQNIVFTKR